MALTRSKIILILCRMAKAAMRSSTQGWPDDRLNLMYAAGNNPASQHVGGFRRTAPNCEVIIQAQLD